MVGCKHNQYKYTWYKLAGCFLPVSETMKKKTRCFNSVFLLGVCIRPPTLRLGVQKGSGVSFFFSFFIFRVPLSYYPGRGTDPHQTLSLVLGTLSLAPRASNRCTTRLSVVLWKVCLHTSKEADIQSPMYLIHYLDLLEPRYMM